MPRKARVEYAGAVYHVMDRGDRQEAIYGGGEDRELFLKTLGQACERTGWRVHSYVLMGNHYHLLLETPEPNLCAGMRWLQGVYTIRYNARHKLRGHLFQGRYKAVLVQGGDDTYFQTVSDYIHLNPVRAGLVGKREMLVNYRWSSFPLLVGAPRKRPAWLCAEWVLGGRGGKDNTRGRRAYCEALEKRSEQQQRGGAFEAGMLKALRRGWYFGSQDFRQRVLELASGATRKPAGPILSAHNEQEARRLISAGLQATGLAGVDLKTLAKGDARKIAVAAVVKKRTMVANRWIGRELEMGVEGRVSRYCSEAEGRPEILRLMGKIQMLISKD
jgi:putative transposase